MDSKLIIKSKSKDVVVLMQRLWSTKDNLYSLLFTTDPISSGLLESYDYELTLQVDNESIPFTLLREQFCEGYEILTILPKMFLLPLSKHYMGNMMHSVDFVEFKKLVTLPICDTLTPVCLPTFHKESNGTISLGHVRLKKDKDKYGVYNTISNQLIGYINTLEHLANLTEANNIPPIEVKI